LYSKSVKTTEAQRAQSRTEDFFGSRRCSMETSFRFKKDALCSLRVLCVSVVKADLRDPLGVALGGGHPVLSTAEGTMNV
jgi:hypothetical protein